MRLLFALALFLVAAPVQAPAQAAEIDRALLPGTWVCETDRIEEADTRFHSVGVSRLQEDGTFFETVEYAWEAPESPTVLVEIGARGTWALTGSVFSRVNTAHWVERAETIGPDMEPWLAAPAEETAKWLIDWMNGEPSGALRVLSVDAERSKFRTKWGEVVECRRMGAE
ncbi:hypothetical protein ACQ5SO_09550 [Rhodovulum sp. DZ06]|uniref:hypothetical protein n=1 Tax=Rhodovulum sp. DZ06 TaxID=3425126 RepID=UPI003D336BA3